MEGGGEGQGEGEGGGGRVRGGNLKPTLYIEALSSGRESRDSGENPSCESTSGADITTCHCAVEYLARSSVTLYNNE